MTSLGSVSDSRPISKNRPTQRITNSVELSTWSLFFFFLLEMLKMFTSSVITSLWHHGFSWYSPVTPLCVLVSCTSIFESSHELLFVKLYCSSYQAIRYANLLPHLGSLFLGRRLQLLLMFLSMVYFSFLRKFKQFSLVSIRWFTFSTFFHTSVVSHEQWKKKWTKLLHRLMVLFSFHLASLFSNTSLLSLYFLQSGIFLVSCLNIGILVNNNVWVIDIWWRHRLKQYFPRYRVHSGPHVLWKINSNWW